MDGHKIQFFYEVENFNIQSKSKIQDWLISSAAMENKKIEQLNIIFCDDTYLLKINVKYLNHNFFTDIITFDNSDNDKLIRGDIFISVDRAKENSITFNQHFIVEINRLIIHGLLHLIGYQDKSKEEKTTMTSKEDYYLRKLNSE